VPERTIAPLNRAPAEVDRTGRAWVREEMVVEPVTDSVPVMEVVARVLTPETVKAVEEALPNWLEINRLPLAVD